MALLRSRSYDSRLLELLDEAGRNVERTAVLLRDLLAEYPDHPELARDILICEHEGDRIAHDIIHRLHACPQRRVPFGVADGHALATAIDDIVDHAEQAADTLVDLRHRGADGAGGRSWPSSSCGPPRRRRGRSRRWATAATSPPTWWRSTGWRTTGTA